MGGYKHRGVLSVGIEWLQATQLETRVIIRESIQLRCVATTEQEIIKHLG